MKTKLNFGLGGYKGKLDGMVFYQIPYCQRTYARRYVKPAYSDQNARLGNCTKQLLALKPSDAYKNDLRTYLLWYNCDKANRCKPLRSWVNVFIHLMYIMAKTNPEVDLKTISREEISSSNLPCKSVKTAVAAGLLVPVYGWETLNAQL